jgi:LuxR family maltose regulon positive regulatory protein
MASLQLAFPKIDPQRVLNATPPRMLKSLLNRPRLGLTDRELDDKFVIAVQAPPGFGKTCLLGQWRRECLQRGAIVAWWSVEGRTDDLAFCQGLKTAMQVGLGGSRLLPAWDPALGPDEAMAMLTSWLVNVEELATEVVLFLDDAHALPRDTIQRSLAYLVRNAPANLKVILASRAKLDLPTANLVAHGVYQECTTDWLRFTLAETMALLQARFEDRIELDTCVQLHTLTEGWPMGLQLAVAAIASRPSPQEGARGLSASKGRMGQDLVVCLIEHLPEELMAFLVLLSPLEVVCPDLAQALTGQPDAQERLARAHAEAPLFTSGEAGNWSRLHPLVRTCLLRRFALLPLAEQSRIHRAAAAWLANFGLFEQAAEHAFAAQDQEAAIGLVEQCLYDIALQGRMASVLAWADRLPRAQILGRTRIRLAVGWALALGERQADALTLIEPTLDPAGEDPLYQCEAALIAGTASYFGDQVDRAGDLISPWFPMADQLPPPLATILRNALGTLALYEGKPEQTRYHIQHAPRQEHPAMDMPRAWGEWLVGYSHLWEGQPALAERSLRAALPLAEAELGRRSPITVQLAATLASALW